MSFTIISTVLHRRRHFCCIRLDITIVGCGDICLPFYICICLMDNPNEEFIAI